MRNNSYDEEKSAYMEKVGDYVLITFCIFFILLFVFILEHSKMKNYQNEDISFISASAYSCDEVTPYDTITDLTGTTWVFNNVISADFNSYSVIFSSNNLVFLDIEFSEFVPDEDMQDFELGYGGNPIEPDPLYVYSSISGWLDDDYKTIVFNRVNAGTDATNTDLISWLSSNATQIQTGYSSTINLTNCTSNKSSESGLSGSYTATITANSGYVLTSVNSSLGTVSYSNNNKVATISISDVNDDFTISATASLIYHNISYNLGNVVVTSSKLMQIDEVSTISITFQPYNNYVLPQYINVEGVTSYQWNYETGVLSLTNAFDNVDISINADYKSGQYTFVELIDSVTLVPVNTFFNLFDFEIFGVNIYSMLLSALVLFVIIKVVLKVFK